MVPGPSNTLNMVWGEVRPLKASRGVLLEWSWEALGLSWQPLGLILKPLGEALEPLEAVGKLLQVVLRPPGVVLVSPAPSTGLGTIWHLDGCAPPIAT